MLDNSYSTTDDLFPRYSNIYSNRFDNFSIRSSRFDYPDLSQYLNKLDNNILKLMKNRNIYNLFTSKHPQILDFMCRNIQDMILLSFDRSKENFEYSKAAFSFLTSTNMTIHNALIDVSHPVLQTISAIALHANDDYYSLKHTIQLIDFSIQFSQYSETEFPQALSFILTFIPYINNPCIYYFFESLCSDEEIYSGARNWLLHDVAFNDILVDELTSLKTGILEEENEQTKHSETYEEKISKAANILRLISFCLQSSLRPAFLNYRLVEVLNDDWKNISLPSDLLNELWYAIENVYSDKTSQYMQGCIPSAIEIIQEPGKTLKRCKISAINLIASMLDKDQSLHPFIISFHLENVVYSLLIEFSGNSFLLNSLLKLVLIALKIPGMREEFVKYLIPRLLEELNKPNQVMFMDFTCQIINSILEISKNDKQFSTIVKSVEGLNEFCNTVLKKRTKLLKSTYGGILPIFKMKSINFATYD